MECPCESHKSFESCCEKILDGSKKAETAEQLMRARYTAYTQLNMKFVFETHDPKTREDCDMEANENWAKGSKWMGLEILSTEDGGPEDTKGYVEFRAKYDAGEGEDIHHELSLFKKKKGQWYFSKGRDPEVQTIVRKERKVGRNEPCICGSGKKYKKCCG